MTKQRSCDILYLHFGVFHKTIPAGELAVPCNLQSATAGVEPFSEGTSRAAAPRGKAMTDGSRAIGGCEPCQAGNRAALSSFVRCVAGMPVPSRACGFRAGLFVRGKVYGLVTSPKRDFIRTNRHTKGAVRCIWRFTVNGGRRYLPTFTGRITLHPCCAARSQPAEFRMPIFLRFARHGQDQLRENFGKSRNCEAPHDGEPCGECRSCPLLKTARQRTLELDATQTTALKTCATSGTRWYTPRGLRRRVYNRRGAHAFHSGLQRAA